jgi:hypothetical protein
MTLLKIIGLVLAVIPLWLLGAACGMIFNVLKIVFVMARALFFQLPVFIYEEFFSGFGQQAKRLHRRIRGD